MAKQTPQTAPALARLGVNIDHLATLRQLRGTTYPSLLKAIELIQTAEADQITIHLREDRRHIQDADVITIRKFTKARKIPLNLEMAVTDFMVRFAKKHRPDWVCFVPEKRQEVTTEGGLDVKKHRAKIKKAVMALKKSNIKVSLFIEPSVAVTELSHELGAEAVEFHTGRYCLAESKNQISKELKRLKEAIVCAKELGMGAHVGHGLDVHTVRSLAEWDLIEEYNIGHSIVCRAALVGLERAVREMVSAIRAP